MWFAMDADYKRSKTVDGGSVASDLYATAEARALDKAAVTPPMIEAFCDYRNSGGLNFWGRQQFIDVGPAFGNDEIRRLLKPVVEVTTAAEAPSD
ncbi:MAG: hypothetical protein IPK93_07410 [Solirubrobacterales bacterium]|nr:hypothetical protein [Solirubrobacterales bacterium]